MRTLKEDISSGNCLWKKKKKGKKNCKNVYTFSRSLSQSLHFPIVLLAFFPPLSSFVGGIIHSAARKLECECHVSVHFDQMRALFGGETQTADSSYAGKMSCEPPLKHTTLSSFVSAVVFEEEMASPRTPALLTLAGEYVHLDQGGQRLNYPSNHLPYVPFPPTQSWLKFYTFMIGTGKDCRERLGFPQPCVWPSKWMASVSLSRSPQECLIIRVIQQGLSHHRPIKLMNGGFWCVPIEFQCFTVTTAP